MAGKRSVILILLLFLFPFLPLKAQDIRVNASVNRNSILIGEPIVLQLEAEVPANADHGWIMLDSLKGFEFIEKGKTDSSPTVSGKLVKQVFTITSFDSGTQVIPRMSLTVNNKSYLTDSIAVEVGYLPVDPNQPYHEIKDIIEVAKAEQHYINYIVALVTILAILALIWFLRKRPKKQLISGPTGPVLSPFEKAMTSLSALNSSSFAGSGRIKQFYIELNDILRNYFKERNLVNLPDAVNEELVVAIKPMLDNERVYELAQTLRLADAVKFAKFEPESSQNEKAFSDVSLAIRQIEDKMLQMELEQKQMQQRELQLKQNQ